jgi:serine/threonine protein phosphatase PrpC
MITTTWGSASDAGLVRSHNEDALFAHFPVFIVADGMGGHAAGEVASGIASKEFGHLVGQEALTIDEIRSTIQRVNQEIVAAAASQGTLRGMGTTLVGMTLVEDKARDLWLVFNVGDSRLYRLFQDEFELVTTDHSEVQELVDSGLISVSDAKHHTNRNVITRALGLEGSVEPDFWLLPPVPGERFLLCSDGLTSEVEDDQIAVVLGSESNPTVAASRLIEHALSGGGHDNITAIVIDVVSLNGVDDADTAERQQTPVTSVPLTVESSSGVTSRTDRELIDEVPHSNG